MIEKLSIKQSQQMEAIKHLADWCKWLVTLETAAIGGVFAAVKFLTPLTDCLKTLTVILLLLSAISFAVSIFWAAYLLFGIPELIEQLPETKTSSINEMKSKYLSFGLITSQKWIYYSFCASVLFVIAAILSLIASYK